MFKNIIFDWSGVVKDAVDTQFWAVNKIFKKFGFEQISFEEFKKNWVQPIMIFYNRYMPDITYEDQHKAYSELASDEDYPKAKDYPGIVDMINKLKKDKRFLAILSSDVPETILPEIKKFGLENVFNDIIIDVPDKTESMRKIMEKNNLKPEETVLIGDSNHEIEIAKEIGIKSIGVTWGFCTEDNLKAAGPDYLVHNVKELEDILLK